MGAFGAKRISMSAVINRARDLRSRKKFFSSYRAFKDALASTMTILFLRKMGMLEDLDFSDFRQLISLAGVIGPESLEVLKEVKGSGMELSGRKQPFHPEEDDDLYAILSQISGGPLEEVS